MFENMFGKKSKDESEETLQTKFTEDETGAIISQEMAAADKEFKEERE